MLKINANKTEAIVFGTSSVPKQVGTPIINIIDTDIRSASTVRNLGCVQHSRLSTELQISKVSQAGFYHFRNIRKVRCYLTEEVTEQMGHAFVTDIHTQIRTLYLIPTSLLVIYS